MHAVMRSSRVVDEVAEAYLQFSKDGDAPAYGPEDQIMTTRTPSRHAIAARTASIARAPGAASIGAGPALAPSLR